MQSKTSNSQNIQTTNYIEIFLTTQTEEGEDSVYGGVREAQDGGDADGDDEAEEDAEDAGQGEVEPEVNHGEPPQHEDGVEEHGTVTDQHQVGVEEDCLGTIARLFSHFNISNGNQIY